MEIGSMQLMTALKKVKPDRILSIPDVERQRWICIIRTPEILAVISQQYLRIKSKNNGARTGTVVFIGYRLRRISNHIFRRSFDTDYLQEIAHFLGQYTSSLQFQIQDSPAIYLDSVD